jgi:hypothetical protein
MKLRSEFVLDHHIEIRGNYLNRMTALKTNPHRLILKILIIEKIFTKMTECIKNFRESFKITMVEALACDDDNFPHFLANRKHFHLD